MSFLTSCQTLPLLYQAAETIADDNAVKIEIQKEALQKDGTDINIQMNIKNKDSK